MHRVNGVVQRYHWGDRTSLPRLLGLPADGEPWAEYWLGTHPHAPSTVEDDVPLQAVTGQLPFLLKLLAAATPLSLQTHPSDAQARAGFDAEQAEDVPMSAAHRLYVDPYSKPEMLVALEPFDAVCGFADDVTIDHRLGELGLIELHAAWRADGTPGTFAQLLRRRFAGATATVQRCRVGSAHSAIAHEVGQLDDLYPDDPAVLVTLLMNFVSLAPGEALFLPAGNLHAYLRGVGVELMTASDNVLRCGLTTKHVDVDAVLATVDTAPLPDPVLRPSTYGAVTTYDAPAPFTLARYDLSSDAITHRAERRQLLLCTSGDAGVVRQGRAIALRDGEAVALVGTASVWVAGERV